MNQFSIGFFDKPYIWIDPRSKIALFIAANFTLMRGISKLSEVLFFLLITLLLINGKQILFAMKMFIIFSMMMGMDTYISPMLSGAIGVLFLTLTRVLRIFLPIIMVMALIIRTTTVSEFIAAFEKLHISDKIVIPFSVMFRFFPTVKEEWQYIRNAMKFRGISLSIKAVLCSPMMTMEYIMVPLLMSAVKISDELSAASLSRGLGGDKKRTCITKVVFGYLDYVIILFSIGFMAYAILT